jgi:hypothetical protein
MWRRGLADSQRTSGSTEAAVQVLNDGWMIGRRSVILVVELAIAKCEPK